MATVDDHHPHSVPVVDLRLLTQSELYSLSLSSSSSSASSASHRFDDDVLIPKIDRSVFNESAGSRKQTYSRLRLAPCNSQSSSSSSSSSSAASNSNSKSLLPPPPLDRESRQIISLLKKLFPSENQTDDQNDDDDDLLQQTTFAAPAQYSIHAAPPPPPPPELYSVSVSADAVSGVESSLGKRKRGRPRKDSYAVVTEPEAAAAVRPAGLSCVSGEANDRNAGGLFEKREGEATPSGTFVLNSEGQLVPSSEGKRKRGRPRKDEVRVKDESRAAVSVRKPPRVKREVKEEDGEMVLVNVNGAAVDLDALADADSVFGEELRKRTAGLESEAELLGFLEGLEGDWSSVRKKRKIVLATVLCDLLPKWWKIILSLKRNGGHKSLMCRRFISPKGLEFMSCKEVSSYLHSYFGLGSQSNTVHTEGNFQVSKKMVLGDVMLQDTKFTYEDNNTGHELPHSSPMPITFMNSYVNCNEASGEVMGLRKKLDPVKSGRLGTSLKFQEPVETHDEQTSDMIANYDMGSAFSLDKIDDIMAKYFGTYNDDTTSVSYENQAMKASKNNYNGDGLNEGVRGSTELPKVEKEGASIDTGKEHGADNIGNRQSTCTVEDMKIDDVDNCRNGRSISGISESHIGPETAYSNVDQQSTSEACSLVPSIAVESLHDSGLYSTATDEKACVVSNNFNNDSFSTFYEPRFDDIGLSGSNEKTFCFGSDHAMPDVDSMQISERIRSTEGCSNVQPLDGQSCINNAMNPGCTAEELLHERSLASNTFNSFLNKETPGNLNNGDVHTAEEHKVEHGRNYDHSELSVSFCNRAPVTNADTSSCIDEERSSKGYSLASYANEHASVSESSFVCNSILEGLEPDRGNSETDLICPSGYQQGYDLVNHANSILSRPNEVIKEEVKRSWNDEVLHTLGSTCNGQEANALTSNVPRIISQGPSLLSEDNQSFATGSGIFSSSVLDDNLIRVPVNGLAHPSGSEQTPDFVNNLSRVYSTTSWEQPTCEVEENSRNNEPINGFLNDSQPIANSMSELMWGNGGQAAPHGSLADTSSALMQSSGSYLNFDMLSGKGANGALSISENFDNTRCVERQSSSRLLEQFEHDCLTAQATSYSKESNVLPYDQSIEQHFSSSAWPEKDVLASVPNIESRHEINCCVWCKNELHHDAYGAGMQTGSVGFMCTNCEGKFSDHVSFL